MGHAKRHLMTVMFLLGFVIDNLTLNRVDQTFDNVVLFCYVVLGMASMFFLYAGTAGKFSDSLNEFFKRYAPLALQYSFGGLLSGMLIFYGRSGAFFDSWPFLLIIISVIAGNELVEDRMKRLLFNLNAFFLGLFSYIVLIVPVILKSMGPVIFVGSGIVALLIMYLFLALLWKVIPHFLNQNVRNIIFSLGVAFILFNFLYFLNIIPPIPLSLKDAGIFHNVKRVELSSYELTYEQPPWWEFYREDDRQFRYEGSQNAFCYASIFAPGGLSADIVHTWEFYDEGMRRWQTYGSFSYAITGGRGEGYRGYTHISSPRPGKWRCTIETKRGQVLGREVFYSVNAAPGNFVTRKE